VDTTPILDTSSSCTDIRARFDAIVGDLEHVRAADRTRASDEARLGWIEQVRGVQRRVGALAAILIGEADEANSAMRARHSHLQDWLARSGQETPRQATATLWAARELERRRKIRDAAAVGQISLDQAKAISTALDGLPASLDPGQRKQAETLMLAASDHTPPDALRGMSEKVLAQVAPSAAETPEARAERLTERDARATARRLLRFGAECDGSVDVCGSLPVLDARRLQQLVQTIADRTYRAAKDTRDRKTLLQTPPQRLADALVTVVSVAEGRESGRRLVSDGSSVLSPVPGTIPASATRISVIMTAEDLLARAVGRGLLADGAELSPGELRRLCCDAEIIPVVLGTDSTVLDVGFAHRLAPWPLRHAVGLRDGMCAFPGCSTPLARCDIHHITPWQQGGPTELSNLVALGRSHHGLIEPSPPIRRDDGSLERVDQREVRNGWQGSARLQPTGGDGPTPPACAWVASHVQGLLDTG